MQIVLTIPTDKEQLLNDSFTDVFNLEEYTGQQKVEFVENYIKSKIVDIVKQHLANLNETPEMFE